MSSSEPWFLEREEAQPTRWLGLIPRQPRLHAQAALQAALAGPQPAQARHRRVTRLEPAAGRNLRTSGIREDRVHRGSAYLADLDTADPLAEVMAVGTPAWQRDASDGQGMGAAGTATPSREASLARLLAAILQPPLDLLLAHEGPIEWPRPLLSYQIDGVRTLIERPSLLLADDMGLGKTIQAIAALRILVRQRRISSALAIMPAGLIAQWRAELALWAPELRISTVYGEPTERAWRWRAPAHLYLTSYETLRVDYTPNPHAPVAQQWDLVILDEAQRIKNADTDISRVCKRLRRTRSWALSGTPLENRIEDLASILAWVEQNAEGVQPRAAWHLVSAAELRERLSRVQLRRRKADVLADLPPKLVSKLILPLTPAQRAAYDRAEQEGIVALHALGPSVQVQNVLDLIVRLKQICNFDPRSGRSSKLDDLRERVAMLAAEGHKALVFTQFANSGSGARAIADRLGIPALTYTGDLSATEREHVLARFRYSNEYSVLVLALRAGGQGLNLQQASYVFHFDRWWNPAVEQQAESRSHRMGQQYPVNVYTYICEGTIEERIERILREKQALFDAIVDEASIDLSSQLSGDDLFGLFDLHEPGADARRSLQAHAAPPIMYNSLSATEFEARVAWLLERQGWQVSRTPRTHDGGSDLVATREDSLGAENRLYVQCKNRGAPVGVSTVRELNGAIRHSPGTRGVIASPSGATAEARAFAAERGILLWDQKRLGELEALAKHDSED